MTKLRFSVTKTKLCRLIQAHGYDAPAPRQASMEICGSIYELHWTDKLRKAHHAYLAGPAWRPVFQVDRAWVHTTAAECAALGLVEEVSERE